jgi:hypothetical protein
LQLAGGDLLPAGRGFATVTGAAYVRQRVALALAEPYGSDADHPTWGSALYSYLGTPQTPGTPALITSEVARVLQGLIDAQQAMITSSALSSSRSQLAAADVIASVDSVTAGPGSRPDAVQVALALTTQAGQQLAISRTVSA